MKRRDFMKLSGSAGLITLITPTGIVQAFAPKVNLSLEQSFLNPPSAAKPYSLWHWMNGHVTKQGITLDLEAMQRIGVGGVFNFDAGTGIPEGRLAFLSPEWLDTKKFAIDEAQRLGLAFTMHNCPGWSSSGGPWITPDISMQEITWNERYVTGGKVLNITLAKPAHKKDYYKDVITIAYPSLQGEAAMTDVVRASTASSGTVQIAQVTEAGQSVMVEHKGDKAWLLFEFNEPYEARSISLLTASTGANEPVILEVSDDGSDFRQVAAIATGNPAANELQPLAADFAAIKGKYFRLRTNKGRTYSQVTFSGLKKFNDWKKRGNYQFDGAGKMDIEDPGTNVISGDRIIDLTKNLSADGVLNWDAPEGKWTILRIGHTSNGEVNRSSPDSGIGLECDKYSKSAIDFHFNKMMQILMPAIGPMSKTGKMGLEIDSYEVGMQNWTPGFETEFEKRNGYSLIKYLPALTGRVVDSADTTERVLWDFRRTQGDMIADNYYGRFDELCNKSGMISFIQPYDRGPMEEMQIGSRVDVNMGEFWNGLSSVFQNNQTMLRTPKLSAALAHVNGQRIAAGESFTGEPGSAKWQEYPFQMKVLGDKAFTHGINRIIVHRFAHQPHPTAVPGMTMGPWGIHFDRTTTWWEPGKAWLSYMARAQSLLQQGLFVADLLYFTGEDAGVYTIVNREELNPVPPFGYDYDLINAEIVNKRVKIANNRIVMPDGMNYGVFVLQQYKTMTLPFLAKLNDLVKQGMIMVGARPERTPGLKNYTDHDAEFKRLCDELWGEANGNVDRKVGKGRVFWGQSLNQVLYTLNIQPDFDASSQSSDAPIIYIHRKIDNTDVYFIANQRRSTEAVICTLRVSGKQPEIWDPKTGTITPTNVYDIENGLTKVPLNLDPYGSVFLVFRNEATADRIVSVKKDNIPVFGTTAFPEIKRVLYKDATDNFAISLWAKPELDIMLTTRNFMEFVKDPWTDFYAIYPSAGEMIYGEGHSTAGLTVGRNGVAVWEHGKGSPVMALSAPVAISGWTHAALVYKDGAPSVYVNGELIKAADKKGKNVHPGLGQAYLHEGGRYFNGDMTLPQLFTGDFDDSKIKELATTTPDIKSQWQRIIEPARSIKPGLLFWQNGTYTLTSANNKASTIKVNDIDEPEVLAGSWNVFFPSKRGAPESITLPQLVSLHKHTVDGVKYFSGTSTYSTTFSTVITRQSGKKIFLDLGRVEVMAEVILNGKNLGILWSRPYVVEITDAIVRGVNKLEVRVTNLWPNRLIGDEQLPDPDKFTTGGYGSFAALSSGAIEKFPDWYEKGEPKPDDGRVTFTTWKHHHKDSPLLESGLIGPVTIRTAILSS